MFEKEADYKKARKEMTDTEQLLSDSIDKISELSIENHRLKAQIEKLKCCENCKHHCFWGNELNCRTLPYDEELKCMETKEHWEIEEK